MNAHCGRQQCLALFVVVGLTAIQSLADEPIKRDDQAAVGVIATLSTTDKAFVEAIKKTGAPRPPQKGIWVSRVMPGGPADQGGLREYDVITKIGTKSVFNESGLLTTVRSLPIGQPSKFHILRLSPNKARVSRKRSDIRWEAKTITVTPISRSDRDRLAKKVGLLEISAISLRRNVIGEPEVSVRFKNHMLVDVVAFEVNVECWNRFGEEVTDWAGRTNIFAGIGQQTIKAGEEKTVSWQLVGHENTAKVRASITRIKFAGGQEWKPKDDEKTASARRAELPD